MTRRGSNDFLLGSDETGQAVYLPDAIRTQHVTILGATGTGKTTLLENMVLADIETGTSCIVIDAHGDLTDSIIRKTPAENKERLHLLKVWRDCPFGLNLLELSDRSQDTIDVVAPELLLLFKRMFEGEAEFKPQLEHDLDLIIRTLLANDGCTLMEALDLLGEPSSREQLTRNLTNRALIASWAEYNALSVRDKANRNVALRNRLNPFLGSQTIANIVGQSKTTVPLKWVMDTPGRVLLISLPIGGQGSEIESKFLGNLFVTILARLIFRRAGTPQASRNRVHLYLDEYGRYATPTTARLFTDIRKYEVSLTVAHQSRADVSGTGNETAELQAGTLICFHPASGVDAEAFAGDVKVDPRPAIEAPHSVSTSPVKQLLEGRHESREVQNLVRTFLLPLASRVASGPLSAYDKVEIDEGVGRLSTLLIDVMRDNISFHSAEFYSRTAKIAYKCRRCIKAPYEVSGLLSWSWEQWGQDLVRRVVADDPEPLYDPQIHRAIIHERDVQLRKYPDHAGATRNWYIRQKELLRENAERVYPFIKDLYRLCQLLSAQPVYVSVPGHAVRSEQSHADARAELANNIMGLPNYSAYVKLRTHPVQVKLVRLSAPAKLIDTLPAGLGDFIPTPNKRLLVAQQNWPLSKSDLKRLAETTNEFIDEYHRGIAERKATQALHTRSRYAFGRPRARVEEELEDRRTRLFGRQGASVRAEEPTSSSQPGGNKSPAALPVDLAQQKARERQQAQKQKQQSPPPDEGRRPPIGRRSPKKKDR
ncbi:helicase HerA-like domain-containing protein [Streptomyces sp. DSM 41524]|uniref:Helicase HerA-like domain-containing protein n=1 Tax=Streptomyces asiaticus subsp. ignotus TaxID=3098222 RepID=A0ABU7Q426_9ACTN|nr:helicase HerA-like domain-containing protein [Streptomyces sp. DSM 41524]